MNTASCIPRAKSDVHQQSRSVKAGLASHEQPHVLLPYGPGFSPKGSVLSLSLNWFPFLCCKSASQKMRLLLNVLQML